MTLHYQHSRVPHLPFAVPPFPPPSRPPRRPRSRLLPDHAVFPPVVPEDHPHVLIEEVLVHPDHEPVNLPVIVTDLRRVLARRDRVPTDQDSSIPPHNSSNVNTRARFRPVTGEVRGTGHDERGESFDRADRLGRFRRGTATQDPTCPTCADFRHGSFAMTCGTCVASCFGRLVFGPYETTDRAMAFVASPLILMLVQFRIVTFPAKGLPTDSAFENVGWTTCHPETLASGRCACR